MYAINNVQTKIRSDEAAVVRVPAVRGIVALPQVDGAPKSAYRSLSQPAVGASGYL